MKRNITALVDANIPTATVNNEIGVSVYNGNNHEKGAGVYHYVGMKSKGIVTNIYPMVLAEAENVLEWCAEKGYKVSFILD